MRFPVPLYRLASPRLASLRPASLSQEAKLHFEVKSKLERLVFNAPKLQKGYREQVTLQVWFCVVFSYGSLCSFRLILMVLLLREHAGTLYFTRDYACRHCGAVTSADSFLVCFLYFFTNFFVVLKAENWEKHENASSVMKLACRCHFGPLQNVFLPLGRVLGTPFVGPGPP